MYNFFTYFPGNFLPSLCDSITTKITYYYVNTAKKTVDVAVFAGFKDNTDEPVTSALAFTNVLHSRNYADIDSCELTVKIKKYFGEIEEMPVHVQLNFRFGNARFNEIFPTEDFVVKGDTESDYKMNLTNLLKNTLSWTQAATFHLIVLVRPSIVHPNPGSNQNIKVGTNDAKITVRYRRKGEK